MIREPWMAGRAKKAQTPTCGLHSLDEGTDIGLPVRPDPHACQTSNHGRKIGGPSDSPDQTSEFVSGKSGLGAPGSPRLYK